MSDIVSWREADFGHFLTCSDILVSFYGARAGGEKLLTIIVFVFFWMFFLGMLALELATVS